MKLLLTSGGDATYLAHHIRASGLAELLPTLTETTWVGVSAGSMVMTPAIRVVDGQVDVVSEGSWKQLR